MRAMVASVMKAVIKLAVRIVPMLRLVIVIRQKITIAPNPIPVNRDVIESFRKRLKSRIGVIFHIRYLSV